MPSPVAKTLRTCCHVCAGAMPEQSPERSSTVFRSGNERLYEAYNDLHSLAQDFEKPFDAPAILVVGHQTDGKSGTGRSASWPACGQRPACGRAAVHTAHAMRMAAVVCPVRARVALPWCCIRQVADM